MKQHSLCVKNTSILFLDSHLKCSIFSSGYRLFNIEQSVTYIIYSEALLSIISLLWFFTDLFCRFWTTLHCFVFCGLQDEMAALLDEPEECFQHEAELTKIKLWWMTLFNTSSKQTKQSLLILLESVMVCVESSGANDNLYTVAV